MRNTFFVLLTLVAASSLVAGSVLAAPNNSTAPTTPGENATAPGVPIGEQDPYAGHIGETVHIVSAEVVGGQWVVVLEADVPTRVTIQDPTHAFNRLSDSGTGNFDPDAEERKVTVMPGGKTRVRLEAGEHDGGRAIYVLTSTGGWYQSTGMNNDPFQYFGGTSGLFTGMALSLFASGGAAFYVIRQKKKPVRRAD